MVFTSRSNISRYENGKLAPRADVVELLETALGARRGSLQERDAIAVADTGALLKNARLVRFLLQSYCKVVLPDIVMLELKRLASAGESEGSRASADRLAAIRALDEIESLRRSCKGRLEIRAARHHVVSAESGMCERDQKIVSLARNIKKRDLRAVDIIHVDRGFAQLEQGDVEGLYLEEYMARHMGIAASYGRLLDLDLEFDHLERYVSLVSEMELDAYLPDGMTLLISCIRCNEQRKIEERGGRIMPEAKIMRKLAFLLDFGASLDKPDCGGFCRTPLEHAIEKDAPCFEEFLFLLERGADYNKCSIDETKPDGTRRRVGELDEGVTPLISACRLGLREHAEKLCSLPGISLNAQDCNGFTALTTCAVMLFDKKGCAKEREAYEWIYACLLEHGADPLIRDRNNMTAEDWFRKAQEAD